MKQAFIGIGIFLTVLAIGYMILIFGASSDNVHVDGHDAVKIAFHHTGYVVAIFFAIAVCIATFIMAWRNDWYGAKLKFAIIGCALLLTFCIFAKPVNIKTDPISSGITTDEINYLKSKGLK